MKERRISIKVAEETFRMLQVLGKGWSGRLPGPERDDPAVQVESVVRYLVVCAADGVRRPGAWERGWLEQAFGCRWTDQLEPGPAPAPRREKR